MLKQILLGALAFCIWLAAAIGSQISLGGHQPALPAQLLISVALLAIYWAAARWVERRRPLELHPRDAQTILYGFIVGFVLFFCTMAILSIVGVYHFTAFVSVKPLWPGFALALLVGITEELLFRGFIFRWVESGMGTWIAVAFSAALFGAAHAANRGATPMSCTAIALEAGVLLSAAYVYTRTLWVPIGLHIGWNFTEGTIFGVTVSGHQSTGILTGVLHGPDWLTGGVFGVEASLPAVVVCVAAAAALLVASVRKRRIIAPRWTRARRIKLLQS